MKILLAALLAILLPVAASPAASPSREQASALHRQEVADFIARLAYAKSHADPVIHGGKGDGLSCIVYTVKQAAGGAPGYTLVIATDKGYAPMADIAVLCDTAAIDPAHSIQCSGHVLAVQGGWLTEGGDGMVVQLGLGKKEVLLKFTGPRKTTRL